MSPRPKKVLINSHKQHKNYQSSSVPQPRGEIIRQRSEAVRYGNGTVRKYDDQSEIRRNRPKLDGAP